AESDAQLEKRLRECGLELPLLADFYAGEVSDAAKGCMLLQYADMDPEQFERAMRKLCGQSDC
ncbi:MAG: hypothetical protein MJ118_09350, partial [Clostridia bacterium]|nr:hypothetical protein [Clostridia bacterium]